MNRLYLSIFAAGAGFSSTTDALVSQKPLWALAFGVLTVFMLVMTIPEFKLLGSTEADLAQAEKDNALLIEQAADRARDASTYAWALCGIRDALAHGQTQTAVEIVNDVLVPLNDSSVAIEFCVDNLTAILHDKNKHWWTHPVTGEDFRKNPLAFSNKLALIHSETSEALEADRKDLMDDKLPQFHGRTVELCDAMIRIFDLGGAYRLPMGKATAAKVAFNDNRPDHKAESRATAHGKAY